MDTPKEEEKPVEEPIEKPPVTELVVEEKPKEKPAEVMIEKGEATDEQIAEIEEGKYYSVAQMARELSYGHSWMLELVRSGRIKAIKPLGGQWRVPNSEYQRIKKEGIPPMPRVAIEKPKVTEIEVAAETVKDKVKEPPPREEPPMLFPFSLFMGGKKK